MNLKTLFYAGLASSFMTVQEADAQTIYRHNPDSLMTMDILMSMNEKVNKDPAPFFPGLDSAYHTAGLEKKQIYVQHYFNSRQPSIATYEMLKKTNKHNTAYVTNEYLDLNGDRKFTNDELSFEKIHIYSTQKKETLGEGQEISLEVYYDPAGKIKNINLYESIGKNVYRKLRYTADKDFYKEEKQEFEDSSLAFMKFPENIREMLFTQTMNVISNQKEAMHSRRAEHTKP